jgi:hypothetical protein
MNSSSASQDAEPTMRLVHDISRTFRAANTGNGTNWRAYHALSSLLAFVAFLAAAGWFVVFESRQSATYAPLFLGSSLVFLVYWRYLLPEADRRADIQKILYGKEDGRKNDSAGKSV